MFKAFMMKRIVLMLACLLPLLTLALAVAAGTAPANASNIEDWWVVRAYFSDRTMVADLAGWKAIWDVDYRAGFVVLGTLPEERQRLRDAGFRLEKEVRLTAELSQPRRATPNQVAGIPGYACYRTVEETYETARQIAANHPWLATWIDIGDTWKKSQAADQGYDVRVLRLTNAAIDGPKPKIMVVSSIHAREYAPAELNTRLAEYLVANYGLNADVTWLLDYHEFHLLLQGNPDGRILAETGQLWRKNFNDTDGCLDNDPYDASDLETHGVDLNRNFSFEWGTWGGSSSDACAETFRGGIPASEPETGAIEDYLRAIFPDQRATALDAAAPLTATGIFVDLHSYGELVLWPYGFNRTPGNLSGLQTLGRKLAYLNDYEPQQAVELYPTDGTIDDFAYGELGVAAFAFEVGRWTFFHSCGTFTSSILPENLLALLYAAKVARTPYLTPAGPDALAVTISPEGANAGEPVTLTATIDDSRYRTPGGGGAEPTQNILGAVYSIDNPPWQADTITYTMSAVDGAFDESHEAVFASLKTDQLADGRHTIFVQGQDTARSRGAVSATFLDIGEVETGQFTYYFPRMERAP